VRVMTEPEAPAFLKKEIGGFGNNLTKKDNILYSRVHLLEYFFPTLSEAQLVSAVKSDAVRRLYARTIPYYWAIADIEKMFNVKRDYSILEKWWKYGVPPGFLKEDDVLNEFHITKERFEDWLALAPKTKMYTARNREYERYTFLKVLRSHDDKGNSFDIYELEGLKRLKAYAEKKEAEAKAIHEAQKELDEKIGNAWKRYSAEHKDT
jgi:hypothetical protein